MRNAVPVVQTRLSWLTTSVLRLAIKSGRTGREHMFWEDVISGEVEQLLFSFNEVVAPVSKTKEVSLSPLQQTKVTLLSLFGRKFEIKHLYELLI